MCSSIDDGREILWWRESYEPDISCHVANLAVVRLTPSTRSWPLWISGMIHGDACSHLCFSLRPYRPIMPVPVPPAGPAVTFPTLTRENIDAARTSQWLDKFEDITANATVIDIDALGERDAFLKVGRRQWSWAASLMLCQLLNHVIAST